VDLYARTVTAPDGTVWEVSPLWKARRHGVRVPSHWRSAYERRRARRRAGREESEKRDGGGLGGLDACDCGVGDDIASAFAVVVVVIVVGLLAYFVVWPLLAIAIELLILFLLVVAGLVGRIAFGHPWIVEADAADGRRLEYRVVGYGAMRRCLTELADALRFGQSEPVLLGAERVLALEASLPPMT
jgi:hypothetical protein